MIRPGIKAFDGCTGGIFAACGSCPPQSHRTLASSLIRRFAPYVLRLDASLTLALKTPCFWGYRYAKTILNRFRLLTHSLLRRSWWQFKISSSKASKKAPCWVPLRCERAIKKIFLLKCLRDLNPTKLCHYVHTFFI